MVSRPTFYAESNGEMYGSRNSTPREELTTKLAALFLGHLRRTSWYHWYHFAYDRRLWFHYPIRADPQEEKFNLSPLGSIIVDFFGVIIRKGHDELATASWGGCHLRHIMGDRSIVEEERTRCCSHDTHSTSSVRWNDQWSSLST